MGEIETALAHAQLAERQLARAEHGAAFESLSTALGLAPQLSSLWTQFSELIRFFNLRHPVPPRVRELLGAALEHSAVDPGNLVRPISSLALSNPQGALAEPLLLRLLEDTVIRDPGLERVIVEARRRMLKNPLPLPVMVAIAHQCFNTEYVFEETAEEYAALAESLSEPQQFAAYAAYRPLSTLENVDRKGIDSLARRQIDEPLEEKRLTATIPSIGCTDDSVSMKVKAQYEQNPYPRWVRTQTLFALEQLPVPNPRILVAGCGTGQNAISTARRFAGCTVLAIDLSLSSLAYARRKSAELGLTHVEYRQGDILALGTLDERFDLIECSGVLHHMEDPFEGWRVLASLLKPDGRMRIGLYSEAGRRPIARARELIAAKGFAADAAGIRACRAAIREDPSLEQIARNEDFYSMSGCRDLLFHVHERCFTLPEIEAMIARLGLRFRGFELADGATLVRYRERYSDELSLADWHRFEGEFPDTFSRLYQFWVA